MADQTREEVDAKIAAAEARGDTQIVRLEGKIDLVLSKIDSLNTALTSVRDDYRSIRTNIWIVGLALAAIIIAVAALFPPYFGAGLTIRDVIDHEIATHTGSPK